MTIESLPQRLSQLAADVGCLANHAHCPELQRAKLLEWSAKLSCGKKSAFRMEALCETVDALITLSHASAAFSRSAEPPLRLRRPGLEIKDIGGYLAARQALAALLRLAPISEDRRLSLAKRALSHIDRDMRILDKLIPI